MHGKPFNKLIYICLCGIFMVSCSISLFSDKEEKFKEIAPIHNMNTILKFIKPEKAFNTFKIGDTVVLDLINNSNDTIYFDSGYGLEIYYFDDSINNWIKIPNNTQYIPADAHPSLPPNKPNDFHLLGISIKPGIEGYFTQVTIRVVVKGQNKLSDPSKDEIVGAYIDVPLHR